MATKKPDGRKSAAKGVMASAKDRPRYDRSEVAIEFSVQPEPGKRSAYTSGMLPNAASLDAYRVPMDRMVEAASSSRPHGWSSAIIVFST